MGLFCGKGGDSPDGRKMRSHFSCVGLLILISEVSLCLGCVVKAKIYICSDGNEILLRFMLLRVH